MTRWKPYQWRGRSRSGMMRSSDCPRASSARWPKIRSAPGFHTQMIPSRSVATTASAAAARIASATSRFRSMRISSGFEAAHVGRQDKREGCWPTKAHAFIQCIGLYRTILHSLGILQCRLSDDGSNRLCDQVMVLKLRKTADDDRTEAARILDEYREATSSGRIVLLGQPVTLQERAPLHLRLDGHVEGAMVEALYDRSLPANPLCIIW